WDGLPPSQGITVLGKPGWCDVPQEAVSQVRFPPQELLGLLPDRRCPLVGENIGNVAVNQISQGMALRLSGLEVAAFKDGSFSRLHPLAGVRELGEGSGEWASAFAPNLSAVDWLAVGAWTSDDGSHGCASLA